MATFEIRVPTYHATFLAELDLLVFPISVSLIKHLAHRVAEDSMWGELATPENLAILASREKELLHLAYQIGVLPEAPAQRKRK
jgi:hypothetical protein